MDVNTWGLGRLAANELLFEEASSSFPYLCALKVFRPDSISVYALGFNPFSPVPLPNQGHSVQYHAYENQDHNNSANKDR
jgi:hypothetical protein